MVAKLNWPRTNRIQKNAMMKKTVVALSIAAMAATSIALPVAAASFDTPVQLASCNPCAAKK
jgi:hypothetical protein